MSTSGGRAVTRPPGSTTVTVEVQIFQMLFLAQGAVTPRLYTSGMDIQPP